MEINLKENDKSCFYFLDGGYVVLYSVDQVLMSTVGCYSGSERKPRASLKYMTVLKSGSSIGMLVVRLIT